MTAQTGAEHDRADCPACGWASIVVTVGEFNKHFVCCGSVLCKAEGPSASSRDEAVRMWNVLARGAETMRAALKEMTRDGCGLYDHGDTCRADQPDDRGAWCWSCLAAATLEEVDNDAKSNKMGSMR